MHVSEREAVLKAQLQQARQRLQEYASTGKTILAQSAGQTIRRLERQLREERRVRGNA